MAALTVWAELILHTLVRYREEDKIKIVSGTMGRT